MIDYSEFAPTPEACKGITEEVKKLIEEGLSETEAMRVAAATMDGAGDNPTGTVESVQTCMDLEGKPVKGLTGPDKPKDRTDEFSKTVDERLQAAEEGTDEAEEWLKKNDPDYYKKKK